MRLQELAPTNKIETLLCGRNPAPWEMDSIRHKPSQKPSSHLDPAIESRDDVVFFIVRYYSALNPAIKSRDDEL